MELQSIMKVIVKQKKPSEKEEGTRVLPLPQKDQCELFCQDLFYQTNRCRAEQIQEEKKQRMKTKTKERLARKI